MTFGYFHSKMLPHQLKVIKIRLSLQVSVSSDTKKFTDRH